VLTAVRTACLLFGGSSNVCLIFLTSLFQLHELDLTCKQYLNVTPLFICKVSVVAVFIVCSHVNFRAICYSPETRHFPRFTTAISTSVYSSEPKTVAPAVSLRCTNYDCLSTIPYILQ